MKRKRGYPAPAALRAEVQALLDTPGFDPGIELHVDKRRLVWLAAGQPVLDGTVALVRQRIREWREDREPRLRLIPGAPGVEMRSP
jgi:hypothetical protein